MRDLLDTGAVAELRDALAVAEATRDAAPVETCLREWRTTAQALADPQRRLS